MISKIKSKIDSNAPDDSSTFFNFSGFANKCSTAVKLDQNELTSADVYQATVLTDTILDSLGT